MADLPQRNTAARGQIAAFAVVCVCVVGARIYLAAIHGSDTRLGWRLPDEPAILMALLGFAGVLAAVAAVLTLKYFNKSSAFLMAAAVGGLTTAGYNGLFGAVPGGLVGLLIVSHIARRIALTAVACLAAISFGAITGMAALWLDPDLSDGPNAITVCLVIIALTSAAVLLFRWRGANAAGHHWRWIRRLGKLCLASLIIAAMWLSLSIDTLRRLANVTANPEWLIYAVRIRPPSADWLWPGPLTINNLAIRRDADDDALCGLRCYKELNTLTVLGDRVSDDGLEYLAGLTSLTYLALNSPRITDRGLKSLAGLTRINNLHLNYARVTPQALAQLPFAQSLHTLSLHGATLYDDDLAAMGAFPSLRFLSFAETAIDDGGLRYLKPLQSLRVLNLSGTRITGRGLEYLAGLGLQTLDLLGTAITDDDLIALAASGSITDLSLADTKITDAGVLMLAKLSGLQRLYLGNTQVTDASIPYFESMTSLRFLDVRGTKLTKEGVMRLWESKPNCGLGYDY